MRTAKESELERCRKYRRDCTKQCTVNYLQKASICMIYYIFKACACYFLSNFYFSRNDTPSKTMKFFFYFIKKALFVLNIFQFLFFNKNLIIHFVCLITHLKKETSCDIETLSIDRELNKEHFYGKIMQKMCFKS